MDHCCYFRDWEVLPYKFAGEAWPCDVLAVVYGLGPCSFCGNLAHAWRYDVSSGFVSWW